MSAEERLQELDITLPPAPTPVANSVTALPIGDLLLVSGHGPAPAEGVKTIGKVGSELTTKEAYQAARQTGLGILAGKVFRIGHLGDFNDLMLAGTLAGVEMGLKVADIPCSAGGVTAALTYLIEEARGATQPSPHKSALA